MPVHQQVLPRELSTVKLKKILQRCELGDVLQLNRIDFLTLGSWQKVDEKDIKRFTGSESVNKWEKQGGKITSPSSSSHHAKYYRTEILIRQLFHAFEFTSLSLFLCFSNDWKRQIDPAVPLVSLVTLCSCCESGKGLTVQEEAPSGEGHRSLLDSSHCQSPASSVLRSSAASG